MGINKLPEFVKISHGNKVALIDPETKVCLGVSETLARNLNDTKVKEILLPIWNQQVEFHRKIEGEHEKINTAYLMLTRQCNMDCEFCAINANKNMDLKKEFDIKDVEDRILPFFRTYTPHKLIITGGEPMMKDNVLEIIRVLGQGLKCPITLQSNGLIINEDIVKSIAGHIAGIDFSTKHMVGNREVELKEHIELCQKAGIKVALSFVYEKNSQLDLHKVIDIAALYETELIINVVAPVGRGKDDLELLNDFDKIEMYLDIARYIDVMNYEEKPLFNIIPQMVQVKKHCGAYGSVMAVFPEGNIYMCQCLEEEKYRVGNILTSPPEQIDKRLDELLDQDDIKSTFCVDKKQRCNQCNYRYICVGKCPASGDKDDNNCYLAKSMIDYQLFYVSNEDSAKIALKNYISYLERIKDDYPLRKE